MSRYSSNTLKVEKQEKSATADWEEVPLPVDIWAYFLSLARKFTIIIATNY